jgi:biopolymer transport protein ExbD
MKTFLKRKKNSEDMSLQITSMADIFMILLVFLLKSYSTSVTNISPSKEMKLPLAEAGGTMKDSLKLEISRGGILVDQKEIVKLRGLEFDPADVSPMGHCPPLFRVLLEQRRHLPDANVDSTLLVLADEATPYATLRPVLASAASAGFVDLQLVVIQKD